MIFASSDNHPPRALTVPQVIHGGDDLVMTCVVIALFLPHDFYRRPDLLTTTKRVDMGVVLAWAGLMATWVGNAKDKFIKGFSWNEEYSAVREGDEYGKRSQQCLAWSKFG